MQGCLMDSLIISDCYYMKQQLLEKRQTLIAHLQQKIQALSQYRNALSHTQVHHDAAKSHVNISDYLNKQTSQNKKQLKQKPSSVAKYRLPEKQVNPIKTHSKADLIREQIETKQKLVELQELYKRKKQLQSIGIHENNSKKINSLFNDKQSKKQIDRRLEQSKKEREIKQQKDKIIQQQLQNVKRFLKQSKVTNKSRQVVPEKHFSNIFASNQNKLDKISKLVNKNALTLVEKDQLLWQIFQALKQQSSVNKIVSKQTLRQFLLANQQFCKQFYITKNEIMRDLDVYETSQQGFLTYTEFYQFTKSVQLTNLALKPNLKFKSKVQVNEPSKQTPKVAQLGKKDGRKKQMEAYLKKLYAYLDTKHQRIIERIKLEVALKKGLLFDEKKYKVLKKGDIEQFGLKVEKSRLKYKEAEADYYKTLDLKYIGLDQILHLSKSSEKEQPQKSDKTGQNVSQPSNNQQAYQRDLNQQEDIEEQNQQSVEIVKIQLKPELEPQDFDRYGWQQSEDGRQNFKNIKEIDKYYKEVRNKYGNEIAWNGIEHYRQDFSKFNQCIKDLNTQHQHQNKKP